MSAVVSRPLVSVQNHLVDEIKSKQALKQYSLVQMLGIWASVALPMGLIHWVIMPILVPRMGVNPGFLYLTLITLAMVWEGFVAYVILRWEVKPFTWEGLKDRLWLYTPSNPKTGVPSKWLFLWTIPLIVVMRVGYAVFPPLDEIWQKALAFLVPPPYTLIENLAEPAQGQWWLLGVLVVIIVFNYLLGEELIFRGILLPKMNGVFGKWDIIANAILFLTYHLHKIAFWPSFLLLDWIFAWATKRFKSYWVAVTIHGIEAVPLLVLFPMAIMGLLQK